MRFRSLLAALAITVAVAVLMSRAALADADPVVVAPPAPVKVKPGQTVKVPLHITVAKGWHIFGADWNSPTRIELGTAKNLSYAAPKLPPAHKVHIGAIDKDANVYEGAMLVTLEVTAAKTATPGSAALDGVVRYQACSDQVCMLPKKAPFKIAVQVIK